MGHTEPDADHPGDGGAVPGADPHPEGPDDRGSRPDDAHCQLSSGGFSHVRGSPTGSQDAAAVAGAAGGGVAAAGRGCDVLLPRRQALTLSGSIRNISEVLTK